MSTGILLLNLGTPSSPEVGCVRRYLNQFLMDPFVVDLPFLVRLLLVRGFIIPFRAHRSARAYRQIWTDLGSPLKVHSQALANKVSDVMGAQCTVALGMRYAKPDIASAVKKLQHCQRIVVLPLFPQYSLAASESAIQYAQSALKKIAYSGEVVVIKSFFSHPGYIEAYANIIRSHLLPGHFLLFSYHGLPVRQIDKAAACAGHCDRQSCCPAVSDFNQDCYRAQCYATTRALIARLSLDEHNVGVAFQSRLGRVPWIEPYTDHYLAKLIEQGVRRLCIVCPSFVVDCLETLEEIAIRARQQWCVLGGESFKLIPCLNADDHWVEIIANMVSH